MTQQTDTQMEQEIIAKGLTAPRITNGQITELMEQVEFHTYAVPGTTTTVAVAMRDGFTLCQEITACVDPANFDAELGKKYAIEKATGVARNKLWELEGYKLKFAVILHQKTVESLKDITKIQCVDGNWNYDPYMHGIANGLILALSMFEAGPCEYLEAPEQWLSEKEETNKPTIASALA